MQAVAQRVCRRPACTQIEYIYTDDQLEFLKAIDAYKRLRHRPHPTDAEVLAVARSLGYRKVADPDQLLPRFEPPQKK